LVSCTYKLSSPRLAKDLEDASSHSPLPCDLVLPSSRSTAVMSSLALTRTRFLPAFQHTKDPLPAARASRPSIEVGSGVLLLCRRAVIGDIAPVPPVHNPPTSHSFPLLLSQLHSHLASHLSHRLYHGLTQSCNLCLLFNIFYATVPFRLSSFLWGSCILAWIVCLAYAC
jgi:hypothetical protein